MDTVIEVLKMVGGVGAALLVLAWLGGGRRQRRADTGRRAAADDPPVDDMGEIGAAGGLLGGELEDVVVGRFALRRRRPRE